MSSVQRASFFRHRNQRHRKRALAVRAMAGEIAWLDGLPRWRDGRVVWEHQRGVMAPAGADLALAQRRLNQITSYPSAGRRTFGDLEAWVERRRALLGQAKWLQSLHAPNLLALVAQLDSHDDLAMRELTRLLVAEAVCLDRLLAAPSAALLACGAAAVVHINALLEDQLAPAAGRGLAAMVLGAISFYHPESMIQSAGGAPVLPGWERRCYAWGRHAGLPAEPVLVAALLEDDAGEQLVRRYLVASGSAHAFGLPALTLRELLAKGIPPSRVVELMEAAALAEPLLRRFMTHHEPLSRRAWRRRRRKLALSIAERRQLASTVREIFHACGCASADPQVIRLLAAWVNALLDLTALRGRVSAVLTSVLGAIAALRPALQRPALELLLEFHGRLWEPGQERDTSSQWLVQAEARTLQILRLLGATAAPQIVHEALSLNVAHELPHAGWDVERYRLLLRLLHFFGSAAGLVSRLSSALDLLGRSSVAQAAFLPLLAALEPRPEEQRRQVVEELLYVLPLTRQGLRDSLTTLAPYASRIAGFLQGRHTAHWRTGGLFDTALMLTRHAPQQADQLFDWLLDFLLSRQPGDDAEGYRELAALAFGGPLAALVSRGDLSSFQSVVRASLDHRLDHLETLARAVKLLPRYFMLWEPLARLFPQQPRRCAALLVRLELAARLGSEVLAPLSELELELPEELDQPLPPAWQPLLELDPALAPLATLYLYAQWLRGESLELPAGVRRALEEPQRMLRELEHLERLIAAHPERQALRSRAENLRARLANAEELRASARAEVAERLAQIAAEVQLAAAEQQVLACYRARLASAAGTLPPGLVLTDDLLNATLLTATITTNRKLLLRLLRASLSGTQRWREEHTANADALRRFAEQGLDLQSWLSAYPCSFVCQGVTGGRVRLALEQDPLRILQMGNYFDTCLSSDGVNAFSTVANACELNKRVIYAVDGSGRVVGRQLIGINEAGALVGFHVYTSAGSEAINATLRTIFRRYVETFALRCGLRLADEGSVPTLFAEHWYDDGVVAWGEQVAPPPSSGSRGAAVLRRLRRLRS